ncbi:reverse transcriptase family protein [Kaistella jeonii]|uniref:reverse transcriptase family protein n=1 Tax=Kaistella jeonii TaxID=266749 RepID=UPI00068C752B|nr:reverse transcriptase family protein [Kaistella jeonii]SFB90228.1 Reverse transcriptase (RNA-dependent DNA polymerase) [Kaistella jeonii]VEI95807.1 Retron-type reverse transcriptase [Kaistella jeonii]
MYPFELVKIDEYKVRTLAQQNSVLRYKTFEIKKKNGGVRHIHAPKSELKVLLKCINLIFHCIYTPHDSAYGFVDGRSVVDNARLHCRNNYVFNLDLKDFFPSIEIGRILKRFNFPPFNLNKENGRQEIGNYIAWLCCENMMVERELMGETKKVFKRVLPQGSPVSPILTNIICERLDYKLSAVAKKFGIKYTRYADDITFSSMHNVYHKEGDFRKEVERIIKEQYFVINQSKVRLQKTNVRQEVTGITVNSETNVPRRYVKQIRMWLYYWENYGDSKALSLFLQSYMKDKSHIKKAVPTLGFMTAVIGGKLNYLSMVKSEGNSTYLKLKDRFEIIAEKQIKISGISENTNDEKLKKFVSSSFNYDFL